MKLTDERIFELISEHTTYELQGPDEDDFGVPTVMNKWGHTMYASRFIDLARAIEAELEKQAPRWISVDERMPSGEGDGFWVLVFADGAMDCMAWNNGRWENWSDFERPDSNSNVWREDITHWMPLPPPPAAQNKEGNHEAD